MKNFDIAKNLVGDGMLVQNVKAIVQESSYGDSPILENKTNMS